MVFPSFPASVLVWVQGYLDSYPTVGQGIWQSHKHYSTGKNSYLPRQICSASGEWDNPYMISFISSAVILVFRSIAIDPDICQNS